MGDGGGESLEIYKCACASFSSQSIHLGGVLEDFNKSIHKIHNLSCITLWLVLLVCWLGVFFFCVKLQEVVIIFNIARRGRSFIK